jgi:DNA helicase HerA-like ATPase
MPFVTLGRDVETDKKIQIDDMERRSGLYILGRPGSGKTTLIKNIIAQDIDNGHGVFFLDPHGDAIDDLLTRITPKRRDDVFVIDPTDETYTFGMNLLACSDISRLDEREKTFDRAIGIFTKLFANPQTGTLDVLLDKYLRSSFLTFPLCCFDQLSCCFPKRTA